MTTAIAVPARQRVLAALTALALALVAFVAATVAAGPASATTPESAFTGKINAERAARGVPRLAVRSDLVAVARAQAARMASQSRLFHNPNLTRDVHNWRWVGENVGYGPDALTVHAAFMASPGHRANILDRDYTEVGVGVVTSNGRVWVAEVFRKPLHAATAASSHPTLRYGSHGSAVKRLQRRLGVRQTGFYGTATRAAVKRFQHRLGWHPTGVVGPKTWRALGI